MVNFDSLGPIPKAPGGSGNLKFTIYTPPPSFFQRCIILNLKRIGAVRGYNEVKKCSNVNRHYIRYTCIMFSPHPGGKSAAPRIIFHNFGRSLPDLHHNVFSLFFTCAVVDKIFEN
jgi:hypothetical protein